MSQPIHAYDLNTLAHPVGNVAEDSDHGWVFGLPRGITTEEWPLDPNFGIPLMHGFSLLLPPDYRCHGPDIVGLSFFAPAPEALGEPWEHDPQLRQAILNPRAATSPKLQAYADHAANVHPRTHYMTDILDYDYAVILLTRDMLNGVPTQVPDFATPDGKRAQWQREGAAYSFLNNSPWYENKWGPVTRDPDWHRAIRWTPRANDPNAGKRPMEDWDGTGTASGYVPPFDPNNGYALHTWAEEHGANHIGGTMRPIQGVPDMGPYHIGFEEDFGGYNFGTGNAQLDFQNMRFDWAQ